MKKTKKIEWDPLVKKIAESNLNKKTIHQSTPNKEIRVQKNWIKSVRNRRSKEEFQEYLHELFNVVGPKIKYKTPDRWNSPDKKMRNSN